MFGTGHPYFGTWHPDNRDIASEGGKKRDFCSQITIEKFDPNANFHNYILFSTGLDLLIFRIFFRFFLKRIFWREIPPPKHTEYPTAKHCSLYGKVFS